MTPPQDPYRELFERSPDAILIMENFRFIDCNPSAVRMLRFPSRDDLLRLFSGPDIPGGKSAHPADLSPPRQPDGRGSFEKAEEMMRIAFEQGSHTFEWVHTCSDGEPLLVEVQLTAVRRGPQPRLHVVWRDIRERKRLEEELNRARRLETVGRFAGGVAHDFNNLLTVVLGHADDLEQMGTTEGAAAEHVAHIRDAAQRAAALTRRLLSFSRGQPAMPEPIDLGRLVDELGPLLRRLVGAHIEIVHERGDGGSTVFADPTQLEQLVVNLAANAQDAMPKGGRLTLRVERRDDAVALSVSDDGVGMTAEQVERAFDPFFTTKLPGRGTGLGLATVHAIVTQNGGSARIDSAPGRGTRVEILLPAYARPPAPARQAARPRRARATGETILLVEDDDGIRRLFERALGRAGYRVLVAEDGRHALELAGRHDGEIALVVTDMVMPRMSGPEFMRRLAETRPEVPALYMSGYSEETAPFSDKEGFAGILLKPFTTAVLLAEIQRLLDGARGVADPEP